MDVRCRRILPPSIAKFETREEALEALKKMPMASAEYISGTVPFWAVEEYAVEIYEADEDGEFLEGSDFLTQDEMKIKDENGEVMRIKNKY